MEIKVPDEIWFALLKQRRCPAGGFFASIRLINGGVFEQMIVSDRGSVLGKKIAGLAGFHGDIDTSMLNFTTDDIEAVQVPAFHFWQRPKWIALNANHPNRKSQAT
jgi:hypothetical protein